MKNYLRAHLQKHKVYQSARQEFVGGDREMILLDANENPYDWPYHRYPDPLQAKLKKCISKWKKVGVDQIYLGNGSDEIINQLLLAFCEPGEESILICPPTFGMYNVSADLYQVSCEKVPLTKNFQLDIAGIEKALHPKMKLCFIPTPNNPTANRFSQADLKHLASIFPGILVIDEAYAEFDPSDSAINWYSNFSNVVILQTFSKAQGMAGARLGMAFGPPPIIAGLLKVKAPYNINQLTLEAAEHQIETQQHRVRSMVNEMTQERNKMMTALNQLDYVLQVFPSDANFFLIRVDDSSLRYQQLIEKGIVVRNADKNMNCENCLRVSVGIPKENDLLIEAMNAMAIIKK